MDDTATIPVPSNLALFLDQPGPRSLVIEKILKGQTDLATNLVELGRYWKIKVWFSAPVEIRITRSKVKRFSEYTFSGFFLGKYNGLCYAIRRSPRGGMSGYGFGDYINQVVKYEPVPTSDKKDEFKCKEDFVKKFDTRFITPQYVDDLWNSTSAQHGGKYRPSDFRALSRTGLALMEEFKKYYRQDGSGPFYEVFHDNPAYKMYRVHHTSEGHGACGRDITISHQTDRDSIYYASEFPGCGNGTYGLIANERQYLWLEND